MKIKKYKKIITSLLMAISLSAQMGCSQNEEEQKVIDNSLDDFFYEKTYSYIEFDPEKIEEWKDYALVEENLTYFDSFEPVYYQEEYLLSKSDVQEIIKYATDDKECSFIFDGDIKNIAQKIKDNSEEYLKTHNEYTSAFVEMGKEVDDDLLYDQLYTYTYLENALENVLEINNNNINEDFHKMQTLKMVYGNNNTIKDPNSKYDLLYDDSENYILGFYDFEENLIVINRDDIKKVSKFYEEPFQGQLYYVISHEINHVRQSKCDCRIKETDSTYDLSYAGSSICTLMETSAESELYNLNKEKIIIDRDTFEFTYPSERSSEALLMLLALTNEDVNVNDYYNAIFDTDLEALFDFYNITTDDDKYRFFKVLYTIDGLNFRSALVYDMHSDEELSEMLYKDLKWEIGTNYRSEIFAMSLYNLVEYTAKHEDFTLLDNLMIFNIIKNNICSGAHIYSDDEEDKYVYDETFVNEINELENRYIEFLAQYYEITLDEIRTMEKENIKDYGTTLVNLSTSNKNSLFSYVDSANNLLNRFPVLRAILFTNFYYRESYNDIFNENKSLVLAKEEE